MKLVINFYETVSENTVADMIKYITQHIHQAGSKQQRIDEIIIFISSVGGSSDHGLLAYNTLKQFSIPITTIGMGNVDSAAIMIYAAGDNRFAVKNCRFTLHEATTTILNGTFGYKKLSEIANLNRQITTDYSEVISKVTGKTLKLIAKKVEAGTVLSSAESLKLTLTTDILDKPYLDDINLYPTLIVQNPQKKTE